MSPITLATSQTLEPDDVHAQTNAQSVCIDRLWILTRPVQERPRPGGGSDGAFIKPLTVGCAAAAALALRPCLPASTAVWNGVRNDWIRSCASGFFREFLQLCSLEFRRVARGAWGFT